MGSENPIIPIIFQYVMAYSRFGRSRKVCLIGWIFLTLVLVRSTPASVPYLVSDPPDGGDFDGVLTITFTQQMQETIAMDFSGTGGVSFDCAWNELIPGFRLVLECSPMGELPAGNTVTWTVNPEGTGFTTESGETIPTTSGTFVVPGGGGGEPTVTPTPAVGGTYDPATGDSVRFRFSVAMDQTVDPDSAVTFSAGNWSCQWSDASVVLCDPLESLGEAFYTYTLMGFRSQSGIEMSPFSGGFFVQEGGGGNGGTTAPDCPADFVSLPFPKSMSICGSEFLAWDRASVFPLGNGGGYAMDASSTGSSGGIASLVFLDPQGMATEKIMAEDAGMDLSVTRDNGLILASGPIPGTQQLAVGLFERSPALAPRYEQELTLTGDSPSVTSLSGSRAAIVQDLGAEIEVIILNGDGSVDWAKRYSSDVFGGDGGGLLAPQSIPGVGSSQQAALHELPDGLLMVINQRVTEINGTNFSIINTLILVKLSDTGDVQWAKSYTGLGSFAGSSVTASPDGSLFLATSETQLDSQTTASVSSVLVRLSSSGTFQWAKRYSDVRINYGTTLSDNKFLLQGIAASPDSEDSSAVFATILPTGSIENQVEVRAGAPTFGFARAKGSQIFYNLFAEAAGGSATEPLHRSIVGSSSLSLDQWQWSEYLTPVSDGFAVPREDQSGLVFSGFHRNSYTVDLLLLDGNFSAEAPCALFGPTEVQVTPGNLAPADASVDVAEAVVTSANFTPQFAPTSIALHSFTHAENALCEDGGGNCPEVPLTITRNGADQITLSFPTTADCSYSLQQAESLHPLTWTELEQIAGDGSQVTRNLPATNQQGFFRLEILAPVASLH